MNSNLLAVIAVTALLVGIISTPMMQSAYAADTKATTKNTSKEKPKTKTTTTKNIKPKTNVPLNDKTKVTKSNGTPTTKGTLSTKVVVNIAEGSSSNAKCNEKCYAPNKAKVAVGGTVTWKNVDSAAHTVTAPDGTFDSGLVMAGKTFSHKFGTAGTFNYACTVHPWMKGTVTVG